MMLKNKGYYSAMFPVKHNSIYRYNPGYKGYIGLCDIVSFITFYNPFNLLTNRSFSLETYQVCRIITFIKRGIGALPIYRA